MAKFVQPTFDVYGIAEFKNSVQFDSSVYLQGVTHISSPVGTTGTPYALVVDNLAANEAVKSIQLGTMATETASNYYTSSGTDGAIATAVGNVDSSLVTYVGTEISKVDTSVSFLWSYDQVQDASVLANTEKWADSNRNGLLNQTETTLSFNDSTGVLTLADAGSGWSYYLDGQKYTFSGNATATLPGGGGAADDRYYIYISNNTDASLVVSTSVWDREAGQLPVAFIDWEAGNTPKYWLGEERHTMLIDTRMHKYLHNTRGTQFISGGTLDGPTVAGPSGGIGTTDASNALGVAATTIADEDIYQTLASLTRPTTPLSPGNTYNVFYRTGASDWSWKSEHLPFPESGTYIEYDNGTGLSTATDGQFVNSYLVFTNLNGKARYSIIPGQGAFNTLAGAIDENYASFDLSGLPVVEYVAAWQLTWEASAGLTTQGKVALASAPVRIQVNSATASTPTTEAHNDLLGLQGGSATERYHLTLAQYNNYAGKTYIDSSLSARDTSIAALRAYDLKQDASILLRATTSYVDSSLSARDTSIAFNANKNVSQDASIARIDASIARIDASITRIDIYNGVQDSSISTLKTRVDNHDTSISGLNTIIQSHTAELAVHDSSIGFLWSYDQVQDASINAAGTSVKAWNGLVRVDNSIGLGGTGLVDDTIIHTNSWQLVVDGSMQISGNLYVDGSLTYINTSQLDVSDNIININTGLTGTPPAGMVSGMQVKRGSADPYFFIFSEIDDTFRIGVNASEGGLPGGTQAVATREDNPTNTAIPFWNDSAKRFDTVSDFVFTAAGGLSTADRITGSGGLTFTGLDASTQTYALMVPATSGGVVSTRALGSNAFTSDAYATIIYVDGSLSARDTSIANNATRITQIDTSVAFLRAYDIVQDGSISTLTTRVNNHDTSISGLNTLIQTNIADIAQLDASIVRIDASLNDVIDILSLGFATDTSVNAAFALRDTSIAWLDTNKVDLAGDTMTGLLTFAAAGFQLDSVTLTDIDVSGFLTGLDTHLPTSGAVQKAINDAIVAGVTASNGLHEVGGDIRLGGLLTEDTSITVNGANVLRINGLTSGTTLLSVISDSGVLKTQQLGTMALEASSGYYYSTQVDTLITDVSTVLGGRIDNADSSITALDLLTQTHTIDIAQLDASIVTLRGRVDNHDTSISGLNTLIQTNISDITNIESSLGSLNTLIQTNISDISNLESSVGALDLLTQTHTSELATHEASIGFLWSYDQIQDASIVAAGTAVQAWSGLERIDNSIYLGGNTLVRPTTITATAAFPLIFAGLQTSTIDTPYALVQDSADTSIRTRQLGNMAWETASTYATVTNVNNYNTAQDGSISTNASQIAQLDASIARIDIYNGVQDASISANTSALGNYVLKTGDSMSGGLTIGGTAGGLLVGTVGNPLDTSLYSNLYVHNDLTVGGDVFIDGSLYVTNVHTIDVSTGFIRLNTGMTGTPPASMQSGIAVERGSLEPYVFIFDESTQDFRIGIAVETSTGFLDASTQAVATRQDTPTDTGVAYWNTTLNRFDTVSGFTYASGVLTTPDLTLTDLAADAGTTALMITANVVGTRTLGSNAFSSVAFASISYVDTSLSARDTSIANLVTITNNHDTSISGLNTLIQTNISDISNLESSVGALDLLTQTHTSDISNLESSVGALDLLTQTHTSELATHEASIGVLTTDKLDAVANATGTSGTGIFAVETGTTAYLKTLIGGTGATITSDSSTVTISVTSAEGYSEKWSGSFSADGSTSFVFDPSSISGTGPYGVTVWELDEVVQVGVKNDPAGTITLSWTPGSLTGTCEVLVIG